MANPNVESVGKEHAFEIEDPKKAVVQDAVRHYVPVTDEEKALDRKVNMKLDMVVLLILSVSFIVSRRNPARFSCIG
jgi:hypothetical protein